MYKIFDHEIISKIKKKTPFYLYDKDLLIATLQHCQKAAKNHLQHEVCLHYAIKANDNKKILKLIHKNDFGADCVSGGEIKKTLKVGFSPRKIVFAGVGKTDKEIQFAIKNNIYAFNTESLAEIKVLNNIAKSLGKTTNIMIRINPDVEAKTHKHISTGTYANKFGITFADFLEFEPQLHQLKNVNLIGLHYHIGSQITDMTVFKNLVKKINLHYHKLFELKLNPTDLDLGGGLGINYKTPEQEPIANFSDYFKIIADNLDIPKNIKLHFELGRAIVGQSGVLVTNVLFTKNTAGTNFAIVDAGMNDLMRPALYSAKHKITKLHCSSRNNKKPEDSTANKNPLVLGKENITTNKKLIIEAAALIHKKKYHIVGPVCESTDIFAKNLSLEELTRSDKLIIYSTGAYGRVLANKYNSRKLIGEILL